MNTDEIKDLIAARRNEGIVREEIRDELLQKGAAPADIEWGFNAVQLEDHKTPPPPAQKPANPLGILLGIFFIAFGIFRLNTPQTSWDHFFGWTLIVLGAVRVVATIAGMSKK